MLRLVIGMPRRRNIHNHIRDIDTNKATSADAAGSPIHHDRADDREDDEWLEPWEELVRRSTHAALDHARRAGVEDWPTVYFTSKWR
eukprot:568-Pyramimonas_sp.AAC.1